MTGQSRTNAARRMIVALACAVILAAGLYGYAAPTGGLRAVEFWWLSTLGLSLVPVAATLGGPWQRAGLLSGLFVAGFAAQLAVRDPFWFQHIRVFPTRFSFVQMAVVAGQGVAGLMVIARAGGFAAVVGVGSALGWMRVAVLALVLVVAAKSSMDFIAGDDLPRYFKQLFVSLVFVGANLANLVAIAVALPDAPLSRLATGLGAVFTLPGRAPAGTRADRALPMAAALFAFAVTAAISLWSFDAVPHLDGIVYLFHARYFAEGMLSLPVPPDPQAFGHYLMDTGGGRWFSVNLPGWPAALAVGVLAGAPWLVNPVLAGLGVLLAHRFVRDQADRGLANAVALLLAVSPWLLALSSTFLAHSLTLVLVLGAWVLAGRARSGPRLAAPLAAGLLMGWLFATRPLEGLFMGVLTGLWVLSFLRHDRRQWRSVAAYSAGCVATGGLLLAYNAALTGSPLTLPMATYLDALWAPGTNAIGFGPDRGPPDWGNVDVWPGHSPLEALINAHENLAELNFDLFGWGGASLFFVLVFALWGRWRRLELAMLAVVAATVVANSLYWYAGGFYAGPRYWFMMLVPLVILTARGIAAFAARIEAALPGRAAPARVVAVTAILGAVSVAVMVNWLALNKYPGINGYHADYAELARREQMQNTLVFVTLQDDLEFGSAFWVNDFGPGATTPLFVRDVGAERNRAIAAAYPDRAIWFAEGRSRDNPRVVLRRGPLAPGALD